MRKSTLGKAGLAGAIAVAMGLGIVGTASADVQPQAKDVVGVGSDTVQYVADFLNDGDASGNTGYNATNTARRVFSFDATADASGRSAYLSGTSTALANSVVLRAGSKPVTRPNGSGSGIAALIADSTHKIDFVRASRMLKGSEQASATAAPGVGQLHTFQIADDGMQIAVAHAAYNGPALLSASDLVNIYNGTYKTWGDVPGYTGSAPTHGIVPVIPQTGSGTRSDFLSALQAANGGTAITLASNVVTGEEHDPTAITNITAHNDVNGNPVTAADAISPFSTGRDKLIDTGYFGTTPAPNTIDLLGSSTSGFFVQRHLYIIVRDSDVSSTTPWQVGGSLNWVKTLFGTATSFYAKASSNAMYTSAGVTRSWADLGATTNG